MHRKKLLTTALLALVGLASITVAEAAAVSYTKGDLFIGFYANDGSATQDYLINIGQASLYTGATGSFTLNTSPNTNIGNIGLDLTTAFTSAWNTSEGVSWGVFGTTHNAAVGSDAAYTLYASAAQPSAPYLRKNAATQVYPANKINDMGLAYKTGDSTANSSKGILQGAVTDVNSFFSYQTSSSSFSYFDVSAATANFGSGTAAASLDLYRMTPGSGDGQLVGTFTISDSGTVTFTAVPEPGACVLIGCGLAFLLVVVRRRRSTATIS